MSDLIRREDALKAVDMWESDWVSTDSAIRALPAVQPKVKPLVWHEGDEPDEWESGPYYVWREFGRYQLYHWSVVVGEPHKTAAAAKAAAQAGHEARILSALEPSVQPDLTDPVVVHANMVRGTIAKPTLEQIIHLYGVDALCRALVPAIVREAAFAAPHVNETPKSEHDARDVLTPATKGERDD